MTPAVERVLVVNTGSSSVKLRVLDPANRVVVRADLPAVAGQSDMAEVEHQLRSVGSVDAVGHRIVHGGQRFTHGVAIDDAVESDLDALATLAPLHNPQAVSLIALARRVLRVPHIACFDSAFHATLPAEASTFAVPEEWRTRWGIRRYGFHGLSHAYAARRGAELVGRPLSELRVVSCHLGAGASLCAVADGQSVDTTMGFTPLDGLVMATRSGAVDPGALLWLQRRAGLSAEQVESILEQRSGLLGLSGESGSLRDLYPMADTGRETAQLAVAVYLHRLCGLVPAMAAATRGLDLLVFTGGAGENSPRLRADVAGRLAWMGIVVHAARNEAVTGDAVISPAGAVPAVCVVTAREDIEIAEQVRSILTNAGPEVG